MKGVRKDGIRGIMSLAARCQRQSNGCWIWEGSLSRGRPQANIHGHGVVHGPRIVAAALERVAERKPDQRWYVKCGNQLCLSPRCLTLGTHAEAIAAASKVGRLKRDADGIARNTASRRKRPDVAPAEYVQWALESTQASYQIAHAFGVHASTVRKWRRLESRQQLITGPFSQLLRLAA